MQIEHLNTGKCYGRQWALRDLNLRIAPGTVAAVIGLNGAGKSTWLRLLAGVLFPSEGEVLFDGRPFDRRDLAFRRRLAYLPDFIHAAPNASPLRHAAMVLHVYADSLEARREDLMALYESLDLLPHLESPLGRLSRGQLYKSLLAPLLTLSPELWLVDEPFAAGMDPQGMLVFRERARAAAAAGSTVIFTTQILEIAERFADVIYLLHQGQLVQCIHPGAASLQPSPVESATLELLRKLRNPEGSA